MNSAKDLGRIIGKLAQDQQTLQENVYPDDPSAQLQLIDTPTITAALEGTGTAKYYASDSFVLDHPVYGALDSATLQLDGGYDTVGASPAFPATFPWTFTAASLRTSVLFTFN